MRLDLSKRHVMTILNITPDSFFEGSRTSEVEAIDERVRRAVEEGATIIDVGGYSSRPGADDVSVEEEWRRVDLGVGAVRRVAPEVTVSVDTFRGEVARRALAKYGYLVINDISAGEIDPLIIGVVAEYGVPYIAMHMRGVPQSMQSMTHYRDIVAEVVEYLRAKVEQLREAGVKEIILDPGFGFAKSLEQNYELMKGLHRVVELGCPVLSGVSRKSMIYKLLGTTPQEALTGTIALGWESLRQGATILRVHDTREAVETLKIYEAYDKGDRYI